jgi:hypothetical protein
MVRFLACPFLHSAVELTDERESHIALRHRELLIWDMEPLHLALADPDWIRRHAWAPHVWLFTRWYDRGPASMHVVAVVAHPGKGTAPWLITAFPTRKPSRGGIEWERS